MFNLSFLIGITGTIFLVSALFAYINYRFTEQDHKMSSMLGLISTMAQELDFFRNKYSKGGNLPNIIPTGLKETIDELIEVSDEEDEDEDEEDDEEDDDEDEEEDEDSVTDDKTVKICNIHLGDEFSNIDVSQDIDLDNKIKTVFLEDDLESIEEDKLQFLKSIHITDLETESVDYKKLPIHKLRSLVVEKGLCVDSSKMKKNEILKLIEST